VALLGRECSDSQRKFAGGDLETPGVFESALAALAPTKDLIFLSVGDTRDHRREHKDPALRTISVDFLLTLLANLQRLRIEQYMILTTRKLCAKLQQDHCIHACVWTSLWDNHPGLVPWGLKPGDMFLMWAQQWRYVARALELGYSVLRADTDVYFAENPYLVLRGPLLKDFAMVVQQDFGGPLGDRPKCLHPVAAPAADGQYSCGVHTGTALLNIGLVYIRSLPSGGAFHVINGTWAKFLGLLAGPPHKPSHLAGKPDTAALIDQPLMRAVVDELAVADPAVRKPRHRWNLVPGSAAPVYSAGVPCGLRDESKCPAVAQERSLTAFLSQRVRPPVSRLITSPLAGGQEERIALAPDWLFGRGCLTHVRDPLSLLRAARPHFDQSTQCVQPPGESGLSMPAPGPAAGFLVATHFVYSMALKRKRTFRAFAWDDAKGMNRTAFAPGSCWSRSKRGILFGHTFFTQTDSKSVLCALPSGDEPECSCCAGLPSLKSGSQGSALRAETTFGSAVRNARHFATLEGCHDYQLFWD